MKTKLFLTETFDKKDIKKIKDLQEVKANIFDEISKWFLRQNEFPRINKQLISTFADSTESKAEDVNKIFFSIYWLNRLFVEYNEDSPADFIADLKIVYPESIINEDILLERFSLISNIAKKFRSLIRSQNTKSYGAPTLKSSSSSVIIKPVIERRFNFDKQDIKDYKPEIIKNEVCVLIELENSNKKYINFQMDADIFERFLNDLIALQIEINTMKNDCDKK